MPLCPDVVSLGLHFSVLSRGPDRVCCVENIWGLKLGGCDDVEELGRNPIMYGLRDLFRGLELIQA